MATSVAPPPFSTAIAVVVGSGGERKESFSNRGKECVALRLWK